MNVKNYLVRLSWLLSIMAFHVFAEDAQLTCHISKVDDNGQITINADGSSDQKFVTRTLRPVAMRGPMKYYLNESFYFDKLSWKVNLVSNDKEVTWNISLLANKQEISFEKVVTQFSAPVVFTRTLDNSNPKINTKIICELSNNLIPTLDGKDITDCSVGNSIYRIYRKVVGTKQDGTGETISAFVLSEISKVDGSDKFTHKNHPLSTDNANYSQKQLTQAQKESLTSYFISLREGRGRLFRKTFSDEKIKKYVDNSTSQTFVSKTRQKNVERGNREEDFFTTIRIFRRADKKKNYILSSELASHFASQGQFLTPLECRDL
ncbi:MAG: hypothetical protein QE271_01175 [Bacteriovoracaceae bacterium]|nr:hypothetical protein [Bacteriovoracaceae bacterium]